MGLHTLDISDRWAQETGDDESRVVARSLADAETELCMHVGERILRTPLIDEGAI